MLDPRDALQQARLTDSADEAATPDCFDLDTLGALAEGSLERETRAALLPHLAGCRRCRSALASLARAVSDPAIAREARAAESGQARRWLRIAGPAAVAALLVLLLFPAGLLRREPPSGHRSPALASGTAPAGVAPVGVVASAAQLRWRAVTGADRYRVTLFAADGTLLHESEPADTTAPLPDSLRLVPGQRYLWRVEARVGFDRWVASELIEFSLSAPDRR